jgi:hypothetical protein
MIRDAEIERLINYAKGLGLKVTFSSKKSDCSAIWYLDCSEIIVYRKENVSKIDVVLTLVHEISHALHNIHEKNRKVDPKFWNALDHIDAAEADGVDAQRRQRKILLNNEIAGTQYWHVLHKEVNLKLPIKRLEMQMEYDVWLYEVFYETGKYPNRKEAKKKRKELRAKHG